MLESIIANNMLRLETLTSKQKLESEGSEGNEGSTER
jgi:hypothetical protein